MGMTPAWFRTPSVCIVLVFLPRVMMVRYVVVSCCFGGRRFARMCVLLSGVVLLVCVGGMER